MQRYEYLVIRQGNNNKMDQKKLNKLGGQGWRNYAIKWNKFYFIRDAKEKV